MAYQSDYGIRKAELISRQAERDAALGREVWGTLGNIGVASVGAYQSAVAAEENKQRLRAEDEWRRERAEADDEWQQYQMDRQRAADERVEAQEAANARASDVLSDVTTWESAEALRSGNPDWFKDPLFRDAYNRHASQILEIQDATTNIANVKAQNLLTIGQNATKSLEPIVIGGDMSESDALAYETFAPGIRSELNRLGVPEEEIHRRFPMLPKDDEGNGYITEEILEQLGQTAREGRNLVQQLEYEKLGAAARLERNGGEPVKLTEREAQYPGQVTSMITNLNSIATIGQGDLAEAIKQKFEDWEGMEQDPTPLNAESFVAPTAWPSIVDEMRAEGLDVLKDDETADQYLDRVSEFGRFRVPPGSKSIQQRYDDCSPGPTGDDCRASNIEAMSQWWRAEAKAKALETAKNANEHPFAAGAPTPTQVSRAKAQYAEEGARIQARVYHPGPIEVTQYIQDGFKKQDPFWESEEIQNLLKSAEKITVDNPLGEPVEVFPPSVTNQIWMQLSEQQQKELAALDTSFAEKFTVWDEATGTEKEVFQLVPSQALRMNESAFHQHLAAVNAPPMENILSVYNQVKLSLQEDPSWQESIIRSNEERDAAGAPPLPLNYEPEKEHIMRYLASDAGKSFLEQNFGYLSHYDFRNVGQYLTKDGRPPYEAGF